MHHLKELAFTFIMKLVFSRCTVSFNNYSTLYMAHSIPLACIDKEYIIIWYNFHACCIAGYRNITPGSEL